MIESEAGRLIIENLSKVSHEELKIIIDEVKKEEQKRIGSIRKETAKKIREMALEAGLIVDIKLDSEALLRQPVESSEKPKKEIAVKYKDPDNKKNTWSGRGQKPKWLKEKLESGSSIDDFLVSAD